jgi:hypothetical protein
LKEVQHINKSLHALADVISSLGQCRIFCLKLCNRRFEPLPKRSPINSFVSCIFFKLMVVLTLCSEQGYAYSISQFQTHVPSPGITWSAKSPQPFYKQDNSNWVFLLSHIFGTSKLKIAIIRHSLIAGGEGKMLMFCNVASEPQFVGESLCTLRFADKVNSTHIGSSRLTPFRSHHSNTTGFNSMNCSDLMRILTMIFNRACYSHRKSELVQSFGIRL